MVASQTYSISCGTASEAKGDLLFVAARSKVVCPPLHVSHPRENKKIYNEFMKATPKPTAKSWRDLAKMFKLRADYKHVFPKLPTMLKSYHKRWEQNQLIVLAIEKMKGPITELLLTELGTALPSSHAVAQQVKPVQEPPQGPQQPVPLGNVPRHPMPVAPGQTEFVGSKLSIGRKAAVQQRALLHEMGRRVWWISER